MPAITVAPVQSVRQSVQVPGAPGTSAQEDPADAAAPLILIVGSDGQVDDDLTSRAAREMEAVDTHDGKSPFPADFVSQRFARAFDGDASVLGGIANLRHVPILVLGRVRIAYASPTARRPACGGECGARSAHLSAV